MKAVLIATDYIKTQSGDYKVLEMNTNVALGVLGNDDFLNWENLKSFIDSNGFTTINLIFPPTDNGFRDTLQELYKNNSNVTINSYETQIGSITIPYIEDNETSLTIRISYDTTAIIDDEYCKDKFNFVRAIANNPLKPKSYINGVCDDFAELTEFSYEGTEPNFIVKKRYPNYDKYEFPKLYKVTTIEELNTLKASIDNEIEYIQEFLHCELVDEKYNILRNISIIYGPNLDTIDMGAYRINHSIKESIWANDYDSTGLLDSKDRPKYITYYYNSADRMNYTSGENDNILMGDGSLKLFKDLVVGDVVKSISIPGLSDDEFSYALSDWTGSYSEFINNYSIVDTNVVAKETSRQINDLFIKITLEDGINWEDLPSTPILIKKNSETIEFKHINDLEVGNIIEMVNTTTNEIVSKTITNLEIVFKYNIALGDINVEEKDLFLPLIAGDLALIQHNPCQAKCSSGYGKYPNCKSYPFCNQCVPSQCAAK